MDATVSVVALDKYDEKLVDIALDRLLSPLGKMTSYIKPGAQVVLKPNFLAPKTVDRAVTTHPEIIRGVARQAAFCAARPVLVTDSPGIGTAKQVASKLDLHDDQTLAVINTNQATWVQSGHKSHRKLHLGTALMEADTVFNIAKAKTHGQMVVTGAVKNCFGAVVGFEKAQWHYTVGRNADEFAQLLVEVHQAVKPALNIIDAVIGMEGNGPGSGSPRPLGLLLASTNAHALDAVLCTILDIPLSHVPTLRVAQKMGLLPDMSQIHIAGPPIDTVKASPKWQTATPAHPQDLIGPRWAAPLVERLLYQRPKVIERRCTLCMICSHHCAAQAIIQPTPHAPAISFDEKKCISCFCCQEMCPQGAIEIKVGPLARLFTALH